LPILTRIRTQMITRASTAPADVSSPGSASPESPRGETSHRDPLHPEEVRVLLLAPNGRDDRRILDAISSIGLQSVLCADAGVVLDNLKDGAAAVVVSQEALSPTTLRNISEWLKVQPQWSDVPFIVITCGGIPNPVVVKETRDIELLGNVTLLNRPLRADTIRSCVRVAVRARRRQYATRRHQENLSLAIRDLEQFAYSASHDLREPLRTVSVYSELLSSRYASVLPEEAHLYLGYMNTAAGRMEQLVRDLLAYTQAVDFDEALPEPISAHEQVRYVLEGLREAIDWSRAIITYDALPDVRVKTVHLQQLLQNLIANAIKYHRASPDASRDDRARIHISAVRDDGHWRFSVSDNGIGIERCYQEQIFGIFKRLHTSDKFAGMGTGANTGIGLAICQKIVERYRGRIWVESEPGQGSSFYFTLPL
jgi:signal transduction histidine kinase